VGSNLKKSDDFLRVRHLGNHQSPPEEDSHEIGEHTVQLAAPKWT